ncbi:LON-domain-containing protein [Sporormia fimetaria CBS 119925]|uniref:LON-domain-containing protein n=1 Tax=Sporormia fimetaria CBS 119925 TaxID=1340428 RepID=A0A6A6VDZ5_9PLEO|nr:LON-domain-containing protein [Sporormia fimetaria CBS 119925]
MNTVLCRSDAVDGTSTPCLPPPATPSYMVDHHVVEGIEERPALAPHTDTDARLLVRLIQCRQCSKPFSSPVTMPCGHTVCQRCLPAPQRRVNISYPQTLDHQLGILCPVCGQENSTADCNVDVTVSKIMALLVDYVSRWTAKHAEVVLTLEEVPQPPNDALISEKEMKGHVAQYGGGRLAGTFQMAVDGLLDYWADVAYSKSPGCEKDDLEDLDLDHFNSLRDAISTEMDCMVCYNTMLDPTTTPCGHTFCRHCLMRTLDHSIICPVCRRDVYLSPSLLYQPKNHCLASILDQVWPEVVAARKHTVSEEERPEGALDVPLFVCTLALPGMPCFLHIFEPRYRLMMRRCMEGNRKFGMLMYNQASTSQGDLGVTRFLEYGTLLHIVNFQLLPDGRSLVETVGVSRFRVIEHGMLDGYDVGRIERVDDISLGTEKRLEATEVGTAQSQAALYNAQHPPVPMTAANCPELLTTIELFQACKQYILDMRARSAPWLSERLVRAYGDCPDDPATFPYWFAAVLPIAEEQKYLLLRTTSVRERLKIVYMWIRRIEGQRLLLPRCGGYIGNILATCMGGFHASLTAFISTS